MSSLQFAKNVSVRFQGDKVDLLRDDQALQLSAQAFEKLARALDGRRGLAEILADETLASPELQASLQRLRWLQFLADNPMTDAGSTQILADAEVPLQLGSYRLLRYIGAGGFGRVFEALDLERHTTVAIKLLRRATPGSVNDLKREARAIFDLAHDNLIASYEFGLDRGVWFLVMELINGQPLPQALAPSAWAQRSDDERISAIRAAFGQLAQALLALHGKRLLHLDLKPANVLMRTDGNLAVIDFGQARYLNGTAENGATPGSLAYSAPERSLGARPSESSDWYSVGVMLHEALTGALPGDATAGTATVPEDLAALCQDLLASDAKARAGGPDVLKALGRAVPLPIGSHTTFVGRERELATLTAELERTGERSAGVLITGEPGIGKSALVESFLNGIEAQPTQPLTVRGQCFQNEHFPLKAFDSISQHLASPVASHVVSYLVGLRKASGSDRQLVVFIDDAQWVDDESIAAVELLFAACPVGMLIIATADASALKARQRLLALFDGQQGRPTTCVHVIPLNEADARRFAATALGTAYGSELATKIATLGRGVPDLMRTLSDQHRPSVDRSEHYHASEHHTAPFVGRASDLGRLEDAQQLVRRGHTVVCFVEGDIGIGKTALIDHFIDGRARDGVLVVRGACSARSSVQYEALEPLALTLARELRIPDKHLPREVALLFPVLREFCSDSSAAWTDTTAARRRVAHELAAGIASIADSPILIFENLQWVNVDSARLLTDMLAAPEFPPALVIAAVRTGSESGASEIIADFRARPPAHVSICELTVGPLSEAELAQLAEGWQGLAPGSANLSTLALASGGNPLALSSLLLTHPDNSAPDEPIELRSALARILASLPEDARRYLEVVCLSLSPLARGAVASLAGIKGDERNVIAALRVRRLVTTSGWRPSDSVRASSDMMRDLVLAQIEPPRLQRLHAALAAHLASTNEANAATLAWHLRHAGLLEAAKGQALRAANGALLAMAPETAAEHYKLALECCSDARDANTLAHARADALVTAGRGASAGQLLLELARSPTSQEPLRLRARGAEQLLLSGNMSAGLSELKALVEDVGLRFPKTSGGAVLGALARLAVLWLRRKLVASASSVAKRTEDSRFAVAASAFRGLIPVDPGRASYFAVRELELAIASRDRRYTATCLAWVGAAVLGPGPQLVATSGARLVERAAHAARELMDAELDGWMHISHAALAFWNGSWRATVAEVRAGFALVAGQAMLRHERNIAQVVLLRSLEELGEWSEVARQADEMYRDALARGDSYAEVSACLYCAFARLAHGEPAMARRWVDHGLARWTGEPWSVQEVYGLRVRLYADLHEGRCELAWQTLTRAWDGFAKGMHLTIRTSRIDLELLRGRIALACAEQVSQGRASYLREVMRCVRQLNKADRPDARCHALLLSAGVATLTGHAHESCTALEQASAGYERLGMRVYAATARARAAELVGDALARGNAEGALRESGVRNPTAWLTLYAPGFDLCEREAGNERQVGFG